MALYLGVGVGGLEVTMFGVWGRLGLPALSWGNMECRENYTEPRQCSQRSLEGPG